MGGWCRGRRNRKCSREKGIGGWKAGRITVPEVKKENRSMKGKVSSVGTER